MKNLFITLLVAIFVTSAFSQTKSEVDLMQAAFGIEKDKIVEHFVKPSEENKAAFQTVYEEYEVKRKEYGKIRLDLLNEYAEQWEGMTDEQADAWMKKLLDLSSKQDKLIRTYYAKVKKVTSPKVATQFYQIEAYILTTIRYTILEGIPFVNEK